MKEKYLTLVFKAETEADYDRLVEKYKVMLGKITEGVELGVISIGNTAEELEQYVNLVDEIEENYGGFCNYIDAEDKELCVDEFINKYMENNNMTRYA